MTELPIQTPEKKELVRFCVYCGFRLSDNPATSVRHESGQTKEQFKDSTNNNLNTTDGVCEDCQKQYTDEDGSINLTKFDEFKNKIGIINATNSSDSDFAEEMAKFKAGLEAEAAVKKAKTEENSAE